eukprot:scaffold3540_cov379-Prasinococcus_capsulatus_cf.AAC.11
MQVRSVVTTPTGSTQPWRHVGAQTLVGAIFADAQNGPPGLNPARGAYMTKDLSRDVAFYGVDIAGPLSTFLGPTFSTVPCMRALCAIGEAS